MYKRVILKLSGEIFSGEKKIGIDNDMIDYLSNEIVSAHNLGGELAIMVGGGNIFRGEKDSKKMGIGRATGDYVGMISTLINAIILQEKLEKLGKITRIMSAITIAQLAEPYIRRRAIRHLEKGRIVIFSCGIGNPYFTTDTAAVVRGVEIGAEVILKGTKVEGVHSDDPEKNKENTILYKKISYEKVMKEKLKFMDLTAITLCQENNIPIIVFNIKKEGNLKKVIQGEQIGTLITQ